MTAAIAHVSGSFVDRTLFDAEHDGFRDSVRRFVETDLQPHHPEWEKAGIVPREVWRKAGEIGMLCPSVPEEYGGIGADFLYSVVIIEEIIVADWMRTFAMQPAVHALVGDVPVLIDYEPPPGELRFNVARLRDATDDALTRNILRSRILAAIDAAGWTADGLRKVATMIDLRNT